MTKFVLAIFLILSIGPAVAEKSGSEQSGDEEISDFLKSRVGTVNSNDGRITLTNARLPDVGHFCVHLRGSSSIHFHAPNRFFINCDIPSANKGGKPRQILHFFIQPKEQESRDPHPIPTVVLESIYYVAPRTAENDQRALNVALEFYHTSAALSNADFDRLMRETVKR